jgi:molybdate transport system ATP-binding protein
MLTIDALSRDLGEFILDRVSLEVDTGEYFVILGPTGAGKTILLETIAGVYTPDAGTIVLNGRDITAIEPRERHVGMVYQDYMLFPHLKVEENIGFGLRSMRLAQEAIREKVVESAGLLGISGLLHRYPRTLSGGEQQRTAIARALVIEPEVLLLDEPLSALDVKTRDRLRAELKGIHAATGMTIIHVTHNFEEVFDLADRVAIMNRGRVVQVGTPDEIFRKPNSDFVAGFVGVENLFRGEGSADGRTVTVGEIPIRVAEGMAGPVSLTVRPEEIVLRRDPPPQNGSNILTGRVEEIRKGGMVVHVRVDAGIPFLISLTRQGFEETGIGTGDTAFLVFRASATHVYPSGLPEGT